LGEYALRGLSQLEKVLINTLAALIESTETDGEGATFRLFRSPSADR
jgi:hypothetical protein